MLAGLTGALVVRGPLDRSPELRLADERLLILRPARLHDGRMLVNGAPSPAYARSMGRWGEPVHREDRLRDASQVARQPCAASISAHV